jgi:hypothetical protein
LIFTIPVVLLACSSETIIEGSGSTTSTGATTSSSSTGGGGGAGAGGVGGGGAGGAACGDVGLGTPEEIAATPRADENLELLALSMSAGVTATQTVYDRVVRDVAAIRTLEPSVAHIGYFAPHDGKSLILGVDAATRAAIEEGTYAAWDCLNEHYGFVSAEVLGNIDFVTLTLKGIYDLELIGPEYETLEGIDVADPNLVGGDGPTICVYADEVQWHWVLDDASGDCPAGCTEHDYWYFTTTGAGETAFVERYDNPNDPVPAWLTPCM